MRVAPMLVRTWRTEAVVVVVEAAAVETVVVPVAKALAIALATHATIQGTGQQIARKGTKIGPIPA